MPKKFNIQLIGFSDAAGRLKPSAPHSGNEDNFYLSMPQSHGGTTIMPLPECGVIMAVADGTGGLRHGDVASQLAIDTVADFFSNDDLSQYNLASASRRRALLESIIKKADARIKQEIDTRASHGAMGSTLIIAWLYNEELTVSWIGDSRAYLYNPQSGITPISRDHSYVQRLIDRGDITYDEAFSHPKRNIVTRCLGDPTQEAAPDTIVRKLIPGDTVLICSDGLTGVLRDRPTTDPYGKPYPQEDLETIFRRAHDVNDCMQQLWSAARRGGWHDNVTTILCRIYDCDVFQPGTDFDSLNQQDDGVQSSKPDTASPRQIDSHKWMLLALPLILLLLLVVLFAVLLTPHKHSPAPIPAAIETTQSTQPAESTEPLTDVPLADIDETEDADTDPDPDYQ